MRRSPRQPRSPPAAAAATARCSAPQPSSEPRRRQAAGPAPSHSRQGGGVCAATGVGVGGSGRVRTPGGVGPGRAPQGRLSWRRAGSRPEGANPHCERWEPAPLQTLRSGRTSGKVLVLGLAATSATAPDFWPLGEDRPCVSVVRIWSHHPSKSRALSVALSCKACGRKARTQPRAMKIPSTRGSPHPPQGLHVRFGSSCRFVERGGQKLE